jgi:hypothetical protein
MRDHVKILGWIHLVSGGIGLVVGMGLAATMGFAGLLSGDAEATATLGIIGVFLVGLMAVLSLPALLCGWGLLKLRPWSRILGIVLSAIQLPGFPVGTLVGAYGLWVLLNDESRLLLESGGRGVAGYGRSV